jgi:hypothetical protein
MESTDDVKTIPEISTTVLLTESCMEELEHKPGSRPPKRKRGGQAGNQNARKHGLYSGALKPAEKEEFLEIIGREQVAPEVAYFRVKLKGILDNDPGNNRAIRDASRQIIRYYRKLMKLDKTKTEAVRMILDFILIQHASTLTPIEK